MNLPELSQLPITYIVLPGKRNMDGIWVGFGGGFVLF